MKSISNKEMVMNAKDLREKLASRGVSEEELPYLTDAALTEPERPGIYEGNHFFDVDDTLLWQTGPDGDRCGSNNWFVTKKKEGDSAKRMGVCVSGLDWHKIALVE
jgi:hypothetical protein